MVNKAYVRTKKDYIKLKTRLYEIVKRAYHVFNIPKSITAALATGYGLLSIVEAVGDHYSAAAACAMVSGVNVGLNSYFNSRQKSYLDESTQLKNRIDRLEDELMNDELDTFKTKKKIKPKKTKKSKKNK